MKVGEQTEVEGPGRFCRAASKVQGLKVPYRGIAHDSRGSHIATRSAARLKMPPVQEYKWAIVDQLGGYLRG